MFGFSGSLLTGQHDCGKERQPPSRPTPVTFPSFTPPEPSTSKPPPTWTEPPSRILDYFVSLKKPSDVNEEALQLLNVSFAPQCDFETLLSSSPGDARQYLPPKSWLDNPGKDEPEAEPASEPSIQLLSNGRRVPDRNEFYTRAKELFVKNQDAFMAFSRKPPPGHVPVRLAHFRKFWEGLDNLAYYWDDSLDEYLPPRPENVDNSEKEASNPSSESNGTSDSTTKSSEPSSEPLPQPPSLSPSEEPRKKAKTEETNDTTLTMPINSRSISSSKSLPARSAPPKVPWATSTPSRSWKPDHLSKGSYKGYRTGTGAEMPDQYRLDCVRSFLEPIAWAFGVTFVPHRRPPVLCLSHIRFPVRMNSVGWRGPQDRMKARQGWMEGPVLGVQCRPDTNFDAGGNLEAESVLDVVRELGGMLLLAQERAREGKSEVRAGEGKWWTTALRWGGGPGGEVGEATGASDDVEQASSTPPPKPEVKVPGRPRMGSKDRRRPSPAEIWKMLRVGNPLWDPKVVYEAIGKETGAEWDEIFMVSSLNHHVSVLKLRVHRDYIRYLTEGTLPEQPPSDPSWCSPVLARTKWFDLFDVEDRTQAMRGIWGALAYLMRTQRPTDDTPMKDA